MLKKLPVHFRPNPRKTIMQFFMMSDERNKRIIDRILSLTDEEAAKSLKDVYTLYSSRHKNFETLLLRHFDSVKNFIASDIALTETKRLLIGAYFSKEYSIQAAALFNPSIVLHPEQSSIEKGDARVIMSFRATGESHISSIVFREGVLKADGGVEIVEDSKFSTLPWRKTLQKAAAADKDSGLLEANYDIEFSSEDAISERTIFPSGPTEKNGIEDVRFVKFSEAGKEDVYYGTYTAYDGVRILSQLIETKDFLNFRVRVLHGKAIRDKGMALFPEKINAEYVMISRIDGENLYIMRSKDMYHWENAELLRVPQFPWEFVQIGNSGSPIKTDRGWLLMTHAVGPFRGYVISAILLDKDDPSKVIAVLPEPLIHPDANEREGYVPNVVYSCGVILHEQMLYIPYAISDSASGIATINVNDLLASLIKV